MAPNFKKDTLILIYITFILGILFGFIHSYITIRENLYLEYGTFQLVLYSIDRYIAKYIISIGISAALLYLISFLFPGRRSSSISWIIGIVVGSALLIKLGFYYNRYEFREYWIDMIKFFRLSIPLGLLSGKVLLTNMGIITVSCLSAVFIKNIFLKVLNAFTNLKYWDYLRIKPLIVFFLILTSFHYYQRYRVSPGNDGPNIIIILIDTLRADHLHCYGYPRDTSPTIDRLAREGVLFRNAYSTSSWTSPAVASLFASLYPIQTGVKRGMTFRLIPLFQTLAESLKNLNYTTGAVVNNPLISTDDDFDQGFDDFYEESVNLFETFEPVEAAYLTNRALRWLEDHKDEKFFLYLHYMDPHAHYQAPLPYRTMFIEGSEHSNKRIREGNIVPFDNDFLVTGKLDLTEDDIDYFVSLYDGEIRYVDEHISYLIKKLEELQIDDNTIVFLTSDHGEEFLDHGGFRHRFSLYEEMIHIPLIIWGLKDCPKGQEFDNVVRIIDIYPTIMDLINQESPIPMTGTSLLPLLKGNSFPTLPVFCSINSRNVPGLQTTKRTSAKHSFRLGDWKLIENRLEHPLFELYNVPEDYQEKFNQLEQEEEITLDLKARKEVFVEELLKDKWKRKKMGKFSAPLGFKEREKLRALGYIN